MADEVMLTGRVTAGKLKVRGWRPLDLPDGEVTITVERKRATRSLLQNAFWWAVVVKAFSDHCGYDVNEMHEVLKVQLLPKTISLGVDKQTGEERVHVIGGSTAKLNKLEFCDLIERAQRLGAEMDIYIPDPGEVAA